ncbi:MAG: hypothetical protein KDA91_01180 [Planctomycetaceae bacterium]|nr:hypothetical protein [Planctomycetaceae bacterium]
MAAQNNTAMSITLAVFILLTLVFGFFLYSNSQHSATLQTQLDSKTKEASDNASAVRTKDEQLLQLQQLIGSTGEPDEIVVTMNKKMADSAGDGASAANLDGALTKTVTDRDIQTFAASDRLTQLNDKNRILAETVKNMEDQIKSQSDKVAEVEERLRQQEVQHSEDLASREAQIADLRDERNKLQADFNTYRAQTGRQIEDLQDDISQKRNAIVALRQKLFQQEDLSFDRADGAIRTVDRDKGKMGICYIDLGERDELQVGTTFSVYTQSNNGVGRRNTEDVKGKIEVVSIMGPHLSEARIIAQDITRPISANDPIYSPLFTSGQQLEIAIAGLLDFDGNPGSDIDEFRRIVRGAHAKIAIQTNEVGELMDGDGNPLQTDDIKTQISEKTRFLIIAETGESSDTEDAVKQAIYRKIQQNANEMREAALSNGVYVISLGSFLEYIGYSRKKLAWNPIDPFPATLSNGAKSSTVNGALKSRQSSAAISGAYSGRRKANSTSTGQVSGLYR